MGGPDDVSEFRKRRADLGGLCTAAASPQHQRADALLQCLDVSAQRGLGHIQLLGGFGERTGRGDCRELDKMAWV